ncbi:MAG: hypothetical protein IPG56_17035 [Caulobacteraceae bacterium]|nr:hypothetical protein [Caulobacteraceae bacterium]
MFRTFDRVGGHLNFDTLADHVRYVPGDEVEAVEGVQLVVGDLLEEARDVERRRAAEQRSLHTDLVSVGEFRLERQLGHICCCR